jgi:hypothetical protein
MTPLFARNFIDQMLMDIMMPLVIMGIAGFGLIIIVALIGIKIGKAKEDRRYEMIRQDPEAYRQFREWELATHKQFEDGIEKQKEALGKAAGAGMKVAGTIAKMVVKK